MKKYYYFNWSTAEFPVQFCGLLCCFRTNVENGAEFFRSSLVCFSPPFLIPSDSLKLLLNSLFDYADMSPWWLCGRNITALLVLQPTDEFRNQCWHLAGVRINIAQVSRQVGKLIFRRWSSSSWESLSVFTPGWRCSTRIQLAGKFQLQVWGTGTKLTMWQRWKRCKLVLFIDKTGTFVSWNM